MSERRRLTFRVPHVGAIVVVALIAFANCAVWALITPNYQAPDEEAHVGYAVQLAENGKPPRDDSPNPFYTSEMNALADGLATFDMLQFAPSTRPPWTQARQQAYDRLVAQGQKRDNGGGPSTASVHGPVYYLFPALAYRVFYGTSFLDRLFVMRLASALLAALTVAFVFATVRELTPSRPWAAAAAGLLAAFQPMFGFIEGAVNADVGVNAAGAALIFFLIRALRRGLTWRLAMAIPAAMILGVLAKATMFAFVPVLAFGLAAILWRRKWLWRDWLVMGGTAGVLIAIWAVLAPIYHHSFIPVPGGGAGVAGQAGGGPGPGLSAKLSYIWQVFFPPLPFMHHDFAPGVHPVWEIYVKRMWGAFGALDVNLPHVVFVGIAIAMVAIAVLAIRGVWLERRIVLKRIPETLLLIGSLLCVIGFNHAAFARYNPAAALQEQGRYTFPAMTVLAVIAIAACFGLGRRRAQLGAVVLVSLMMALSGFAQLFVFSSYFT
jgi:4-amino-4-deoxy-L-arabinose transferase-like glycosyltransferase